MWRWRIDSGMGNCASLQRRIRHSQPSPLRTNFNWNSPISPAGTFLGQEQGNFLPTRKLCIGWRPRSWKASPLPRFYNGRQVELDLSLMSRSNTSESYNGVLPEHRNSMANSLSLTWPAMNAAQIRLLSTDEQDRRELRLTRAF